MKKLLHLTAAVWTSVFGRISWAPPRWIVVVFGKPLGWLFRLIRNPKVAIGLGVVALLVIGGYVTWFFWPRPPEPSKLSIKVVAPEAPIIGEDEPPQQLRLHFSGSAATLETVDREVSEGITMEPPASGKWLWKGDSVLVFKPEAHWGIGQEYTVSLASSLFADHVILETNEVVFETEGFSAELTDAEFHQDPVDPKVKKVIATVRFSHPVDRASLERVVSLKLRKPNMPNTGKAFNFVVSYDEHDGEAYIHSDTVPLPESDMSMDIFVGAGVKAAAGSPPTTEPLSETVNVPGKFNLFKVRRSSITLVRNEQYEPEHVLVLETTAGVVEPEISSHLETWVLPKDRKARGKKKIIKDYRWQNREQIGPKVLKQSSKLDLESIPAEQEFASQHTYKLRADPGRYVYLRVTKGVQAHGGYILAKTFDQIIRVPEYPRELEIMHDGAILSLSGSKRLNVLSRGMDKLKIDLARVMPSELNHLLSQTSGDFRHPHFQNYRFNEQNISQVFTETRELDSSDPAKSQYSAVDFSEYLRGDKEAAQYGLFVLQVSSDKSTTTTSMRHRSRAYEDDEDEGYYDDEEEGYHDEDEDEGYYDNYDDYEDYGHRSSGGSASDRRFILITDIGILVKTDNAKKRHVFVQSIRTGSPIVDARVDVLGKNGLTVLTRRTDGKGKATFPNLKDFKAEKQPVAFVVHKGKDLSFIPFDRSDRVLNFSRFDVGGKRTEGSSARLEAYLFSDRGIYRPGDKFNIGIIAKSSDWSKAVSGVPIQVVITDPRGLEIKRFQRKLPDGGFMDVAHKTEENSPTGTYTIRCYVVKDKKKKSFLGSTTVRVEEFLPDRLRITAKFTQPRVEGWIPPQDLGARVGLYNLFGTPAVEHRVSASISLRPRHPGFKRYPDYRFYDPRRAERTYEERLEDEYTDESGVAEFDLDLDRFANATYRVSFLAEGYELDGGRGVSAETSILVSPLKYLIGYKVDTGLRYVKRDTDRSVELIAIAPDLKKTKVGGLKAVVIKQRYVSVLVKQSNGVYKYHSVLKDITRDTSKLTIPAKGKSIPLPTDTAGNFVLSIRDQNDNELNRIPFFIMGDANLSRDLERTAELQVQLDRQDYATGDMIEVSILAPYVGAGLITIERDRIYAHKWFKTDTTSSVHKIEVPAGLEGNGYVNVSFVRSLESQEIFMSPLSYGVVPFSVSREARTVQVDLTAPDLKQPGASLSVGYSTNKPAKIAIFGVDEGILQVANYQTPDPLDHFMSKRALEVTTRQILDLILPEYGIVKQLSKEGGGEDEEALAKNLNPFKRKRQAPVAFWSGILDAGPETKTQRYKIPDYFNGTMRLMAVAVAEDSVGVAEKKTVVRGPFVLSPNTPLFVGPGDVFEASTAVANNVEGSGPDAQVKVSLQIKGGLEVQGKAEQTINISEGREKAVRFTVKALEKLGNADLLFSASRKKKKASISSSLSIRPPTPYVTRLRVGSITDDKVELPIARQMYPHFRKLQVSVSPLPLGVAHGLIAFLDKFPYGCTEQLVSRSVPALVLKTHPEFGYKKKKAAKITERTIGILQGRQNNQGAFGFWAANSHVSAFQAVYAMHYLTVASKSGYRVPGKMMAKGLKALRRISRANQESLSDARTQAYAIYVLALNGELATDQLASLRQCLTENHKDTWKKDVLVGYMAATYKLMRDAREARRLVSEIDLTTEATSDYNNYYDDLSHVAQTLYLIASHFDSRLDDVDDKLLSRLVKAIESGRYNTLSSAYVVYALAAYASAVEGPGRAKVLKKAKVYGLSAAGKETEIELGKGLFPKMDFSAEARKLRISSSSDLPLFYQVTVAGFDRAPPTQAIKEGIEVHRDYQNDAGETISEAGIGDQMEVRLRLRSTDGNTHRNVAIVDLLPGGFDPVIGRGDQGYTVGRIGTSESSWKPQYADVREDRVVLFGRVTDQVQEFVYNIKATARGTFRVPPVLGEAMYERGVQARSLGASIAVKDDQ